MIIGTFFYRKKAGRKALLCCSPMRPRFQTSKNALESIKTLEVSPQTPQTFVRNYVSLISLPFLVELMLNNLY
jgi:hypothetical protein